MKLLVHANYRRSKSSSFKEGGIFQFSLNESV